jgi:hypothetical protein
MKSTKLGMLKKEIEAEIKFLHNYGPIGFRMPKANFEDEKTWPNQVWLNVVALSMDDCQSSKRTAIILASLLLAYLSSSSISGCAEKLTVYQKIISYLEGKAVAP